MAGFRGRDVLIQLHPGSAPETRKEIDWNHRALGHSPFQFILAARYRLQIRPQAHPLTLAFDHPAGIYIHTFRVMLPVHLVHLEFAAVIWLAFVLVPAIPRIHEDND